ncbi:MAG: hypothetical protein DSY80_00040 [Desulfocapsa sp.]|nr:MAG: hypothetical protein DSY80_00040 [Desulfocapsa sp.]
MRPSVILFSFLCSLLVVNAFFYIDNSRQLQSLQTILPAQQRLVKRYGLTDLALSSEARYTRHPAVTDPMAPYMDHPGAIEHFPSGSFVLPLTKAGR